jgi:hypothetical protein
MAQDQLGEARLPRLWQFRGIGTSMVGRLDHPDLAPWHYRQFAVTVFYIPVWLGRFYAVQRSHKAGAWMVRDSLSGAEMVARYGRKAYWRFKLGVMVIPLIAFAVFAALLARSLWLKAHPPV